MRGTHPPSRLQIGHVCLHATQPSASSLLPAAPKARASSRALSPWLARNPSKRWTELFFLAYSPVWICWCLGILVPFKIYEVMLACKGAV